MTDEMTPAPGPAPVPAAPAPVYPEDHVGQRFSDPSPRASRLPPATAVSRFTEEDDDEPGPWRQVWITLVHGLAVTAIFFIIGFFAWLLGQAGEWWEHHGMWAPVAWVLKAGELGIALLDVYSVLRYVGRHAFKAGH